MKPSTPSEKTGAGPPLVPSLAGLGDALQPPRFSDRSLQQCRRVLAAFWKLYCPLHRGGRRAMVDAFEVFHTVSAWVYELDLDVEDRRPAESVRLQLEGLGAFGRELGLWNELGDGILEAAGAYYSVEERWIRRQSLPLDDILEANGRRSFDFRLLHLTLCAVLEKAPSPELFSWLGGWERLTELEDDLASVDRDFEVRTFNVWAMAAEAEGRHGLEALREYREELDRELIPGLSRLPSPLGDRGRRLLQRFRTMAPKHLVDALVGRRLLELARRRIPDRTRREPRKPEQNMTLDYPSYATYSRLLDWLEDKKSLDHDALDRVFGPELGELECGQLELFRRFLRRLPAAFPTRRERLGCLASIAALLRHEGGWRHHFDPDLLDHTVAWATSADPIPLGIRCAFGALTSDHAELLRRGIREGRVGRRELASVAYDGEAVTALLAGAPIPAPSASAPPTWRAPRLRPPMPRVGTASPWSSAPPVAGASRYWSPPKPSSTSWPGWSPPPSPGSTVASTASPCSTTWAPTSASTASTPSPRDRVPGWWPSSPRR
ncbi:MAG: hypothetical protein MI919_27550 [Holophagales bacterium]|nr:hypothetical protein [Holophagales bacterium]